MYKYIARYTSCMYEIFSILNLVYICAHCTYKFYTLFYVRTIICRARSMFYFIETLLLIDKRFACFRKVHRGEWRCSANCLLHKLYKTHSPVSAPYKITETLSRLNIGTFSTVLCQHFPSWIMLFFARFFSTNYFGICHRKYLKL